MYTLTKTFFFEAGHALVHHDGKCRNPHGHSYKLTVHIKGSDLNEEGPKKGMLIDFQEISDAVNPLIREKLDHKWLNETLVTDSPTSEAIAFWVYHQIKPKIPQLHAITIQETSTSQVIYTEKD